MSTITLSKSTVASSFWGEVQPLTTVWTPPAGCPTIVQFQSISGVGSPVADQHCAPPNYQNVWWNNGYYSPGVCPSGYTVAATIGSGQTLNDNLVGPDQTAGICVPRWVGTNAYLGCLASLSLRR